MTPAKASCIAYRWFDRSLQLFAANPVITSEAHRQTLQSDIAHRCLPAIADALASDPRSPELLAELADLKDLQAYLSTAPIVRQLETA